MAGALTNSRRERFAQELAMGKTKDQAYRCAGYKPDRGHASRMAANGNIAARVAEIQGMAAEKAAMTAADIAAQLDEDRALAHKHKQASAAVSASMGQARVLGLIVDKHAVGTKRLEDMTEPELEALLGISDAGTRNPG